MKLLAFWYINQLINARWKAFVTESYYMKNGTRQGSVLSPYLFSVYMRALYSSVITRSCLDCHIGSMPCNILLCADDILLMSPSWHSQQKLFDMCGDVASAYDTKFKCC